MCGGGSQVLADNRNGKRECDCSNAFFPHPHINTPPPPPPPPPSPTHRQPLYVGVGAIVLADDRKGTREYVCIATPFAHPHNNPPPPPPPHRQCEHVGVVAMFWQMIRTAQENMSVATPGPHPLCLQSHKTIGTDHPRDVYITFLPNTIKKNLLPPAAALLVAWQPGNLQLADQMVVRKTGTRNVLVTIKRGS